jgi:RTA1 like protein
MSHVDPNDLVSYGPGANCVLDQSSPYYCPVSTSVYGYLPALGANITFLIFFFIAMCIQTYQGLRWRTWWFSGAMVIGSICEILGYGGRIILWQNPFSFNGFMLQITTITLGPAFFSAAIYFTLSRIVIYLGRKHSRLPPRAYYWIFVPCDLVSLALQGTGGGLSSSSSGGSNVAVDIAIAGLSFQVITLCVFIALAVDFAVRYLRARKRSEYETTLPAKFKVFIGFLSMAIILILIRCGYRIAELKGGYTGPGSQLIRDEGLFIALEGVVIVLATICLIVAHPGPVFSARTGSERKGHLEETGSGQKMTEEVKF